LVFPFSQVFCYSFLAGISFAIFSLIKGAVWPIPVYGMIITAAAIILWLTFNLFDKITDDLFSTMTAPKANSPQEFSAPKIKTDIIFS